MADLPTHLANLYILSVYNIKNHISMSVPDPEMTEVELIKMDNSQFNKLIRNNVFKMLYSNHHYHQQFISSIDNVAHY